MRRFSAFSLFAEALRGHRDWPEHWPDKPPKAAYDAIIVGAGALTGNRLASSASVNALTHVNAAVALCNVATTGGRPVSTIVAPLSIAAWVTCWHHAGTIHWYSSPMWKYGITMSY